MSIAGSKEAKSRAFGIIVVAAFGMLSIIGSGGPQYVVRPSQSEVTASNTYYKATLSPVCSGSCNAFILSIENKTNKDLEIDWNKTLFVANGSTSGGFMFEGIVYSQRNAPKQPDMVFANSSFRKTIWPINLVDFTSGKYGGWTHSGMPSGENGIYLTVRSGSDEIREKLTVTLNTIKVGK